MATDKLYDVLIIGGGPFGLGCATTLARQNHTALILDSGSYRNDRASHMHGFAGFDHVPPEEFRAKIRGEFEARYPCIEYKRAEVKTVKKLDSGFFEAVDAEGVAYQGRKLALGTGIRDKIEDEAPGYEECYGKGIYHCMYCHGFEERGVESAGLTVTGAMVLPGMIDGPMKMVKQLAKSLTVYTNGNAEIEAAARAAVKSTKVKYDTRKIARYDLVDGGPSVKITFDDGSSAVEGFVANHPMIEGRAPFPAQLGLKMARFDKIEVSEPYKKASLEGVYAGGDLATMYMWAMSAMHTGTLAAIGIIHDLHVEMDADDTL